MTDEPEKTLRELHRKHGNEFIGATRVYLENLRIGREMLNKLKYAHDCVEKAADELKRWMDDHNLTEEDLK